MPKSGAEILLECFRMRLEDYRAKLGWSKAHLAREASINVGTVIDAEKGKRIYKATA